MSKEFGNKTSGEIKKTEGKSRCPLELLLLLGVRELSLVTRDLLTCASREAVRISQLETLKKYFAFE